MRKVFERLKARLLSKQYAYKFVFDGAFGKVVLQDLTKFCRGIETTFDADPRMHALLEGRREVLLRIAQHMNLSLDDLWAIYDGRADKND